MLQLDLDTMLQLDLDTMLQLDHNVTLVSGAGGAPVSVRQQMNQHIFGERGRDKHFAQTISKGT